MNSDAIESNLFPNRRVVFSQIIHLLDELNALRANGFSLNLCRSSNWLSTIQLSPTRWPSFVKKKTNYSDAFDCYQRNQNWLSNIAPSLLHYLHNKYRQLGKLSIDFHLIFYMWWFLMFRIRSISCVLFIFHYFDEMTVV